MEHVLEWAFRHPLLVLVLGVGAFVLWLAAPITWRDGEGCLVEDGEKVRCWAGLGAAWGGNVSLWIISRGTRR